MPPAGCGSPEDRGPASSRPDPLPDVPGAAAAVRAARSGPVPVLLFPAVTETPGRHIAPFTVSPAAFGQYLDAVLAAGYRCTTVSGLMSERADGQSPSAGP